MHIATKHIDSIRKLGGTPTRERGFAQDQRDAESHKEAKHISSSGT